LGAWEWICLYSSDTTFYDWKPLKSGLSGGRKSSVKSAKDWLSHISLFHQNCYALVGSQVPIYAPHNPLREIWHIVVNVENIVCYLLEGGRGYGHEIILFASGYWVTKYRFNISILGGTWYSRFDFSLLILRAGLSTNLIWKCRKVPWCLTAPGYQKNNC